MNDQITSQPDHGTPIAIPESLEASPRMQAFIDEWVLKMNARVLGAALILQEYTVLTVPTASEWDNGSIIVSDEVGGRTIATSDGTNWRRVSDGAIVS